MAALSPRVGSSARRAGRPCTLVDSTHEAAGRLTASASDMTYQGGIDNVGVTSGTPQVYLVFYGSQWGTQSTNAQGYSAFSGDPNGMAPDVQAFFGGLGTSNELWSGVLTQYCETVPWAPCSARPLRRTWPTPRAAAC